MIIALIEKIYFHWHRFLKKGLARLVGGNRYEAATIAPAMIIFLPLLLYGIFELGLFPKSMVNQDALTFFWVILAGGLWLPCAVSQFCRWKSPVTAAQHTDRWKFRTFYELQTIAFCKDNNHISS